MELFKDINTALYAQTGIDLNETKLFLLKAEKDKWNRELSRIEFQAGSELYQQVLNASIAADNRYFRALKLKGETQ